MPTAGLKNKLQYFLDYYFLKTAAVCAAIVVVLMFVMNYLRPQPPTVLYAAVYDLTLESSAKEALRGTLAQMYGGETKPTQVIIDDTFRTDSAKDVERIQVLAANHAVDVIICPRRDVMDTYAAYGYFIDLKEVLPQEAAVKAEEEGRFIVVPGMLWTDEISFEDHESGRGPEKPYILDLSGLPGWDNIAGVGTEGFLGVVLDTPHEEMSAGLIGELAEDSES